MCLLVLFVVPIVVIVLALAAAQDAGCHPNGEDAHRRVPIAGSGFTGTGEAAGQPADR
jgi:hypothetical protein